MKYNVVFLGATDNYPVKFTATNSKNELIARGLLPYAEQISFINSPIGLKNVKAGEQTGIRHGLNYHIFSNTSKTAILKNTRTVYQLLKQKRSKTAQNIIVIEHNYLPFFLLFRLFAKRLGYKVFVIITEWHLYFENMPLIKRADFYLFDNYFGHLVHGIFPISRYLEDKMEHFKKPVLRIPILADFEALKPVHYAPAEESEEYFMYCGSLGYYSVIQFIVRAYKLFLESGHRQQLRLVLNGHPDTLQKLEAFIAGEGLQEKVIIEQKLPFATLLARYQHALALLIPLRPDRQDKARFSHKIGEYLSSGRPILTGKVGDINFYFEHGVNAFLADDYTEAAYADQMKQIACDKTLTNQVGLAGRKLGEEAFNYITYGKNIASFLDSVH